jgi:hypothetical protein
VIDNMKSVIRSSNELQSTSFVRSDDLRTQKLRNRDLGDDHDDDALEANDGDDVIDDRMVALAAQIKYV